MVEKDFCFPLLSWLWDFVWKFLTCNREVWSLTVLSHPSLTLPLASVLYKMCLVNDKLYMDIWRVVKWLLTVQTWSFLSFCVHLLCFYFWSISFERKKSFSTSTYHSNYIFMFITLKYIHAKLGVWNSSFRQYKVVWEKKKWHNQLSILGKLT